MASQKEPRSLPDSITVEWRVDDIRDRAEALDVELSLDEQCQALQRIERAPDAKVGACQDVIDTHIANFVRERHEGSRLA